MKNFFSILRRCSLFDGIADEDLLRMLDCLGARVEQFDKKYTIFSEGSPARYIGILLSGIAHTVQIDYYGNRSILDDIHPCELFAEDFACAAADALPISVIADEPCLVMLIDASHVLHTCCNNCSFHQRLIYNLMRALADRSIQTQQRMEITSKRTTREKLLAYLLSCEKQAGSSSFSIPFDRQELADYLEVDRSGLSSEIGKLRREGVLESHRREFTLL